MSRPCCLTQRSPHLSSHAGQISLSRRQDRRRPMLPRSTPPCARRRRKSASSATSSSRSAISTSMEPPSGFASCRRWRGSKPGLQARRSTKARSVDAFEVPLAFLMNPENHQIHSARIPRHGALLLRHAVRRAVHIWGATAGILRVLYERIYLRMIRPVLTELAIFLIPFVGLCDVF